MKACYNCKGINKDMDIYCRNCGYKMRKKGYFIIINIGTVLVFIILLFIIALFVVSYYFL